MKNFFKELFGKKATDMNNMSNQSQQATSENAIVDQLIPKEEFIDVNPPVEHIDIARASSSVRQFLNQNHHEKGFLEGYEYHSGEFLKRQLDAIGAHFRQLLDAEKERIIIERTDLQMHVSQVGDAFQEIQEQLRIKIAEKDAQIGHLEMQKSLSVEFNGWISEPIHQFRIGFEKGIVQYLKEKQLFETYQIL